MLIRDFYIMDRLDKKIKFIEFARSMDKLFVNEVIRDIFHDNVLKSKEYKQYKLDMVNNRLS